MLGVYKKLYLYKFRIFYRDINQFFEEIRFFEK